MAHGDAREGKWRGNWQMECVASTLPTTLEHGISSITTADAHTSAASSRLNWRPRRFKWTRPFRWKMKSVFARVPSHFRRSLTLKLLQPCNKGTKMNCWEELYMNMLYKQGLLIPEQHITDTNPLFDLATIPCDLQTTSPNSSSQPAIPYTHTTG
jgi:hypothetical protein